MRGTLRALLAILQWEGSRLGVVVLAFLLLDVPSVLWVGTWESALLSHSLFSCCVAVLLGALSATSGIQEANLDFLLARRVSRSSVWLASVAAGLALLAGFALWPLLAAPFQTGGELSAALATPRFRITGIVLGAVVTMLFFTASAAAGLSRRPAAAVPITLALTLVLGVITAVLSESRALAWWALDWEWYQALSQDLPRHMSSWLFLVSGASVILAIPAATLSWASLLLHRDPLQRRRPAITFGVLLLAGGTTLSAIALDVATTSPGEAVTELARTKVELRALSIHVTTQMGGGGFGVFPRQVLLLKLAEELERTPAGTPQERRLVIALARLGDPRGLSLCAARVRQLTESGLAPESEDFAAIECLVLAGADRESRDAIFTLAEREVAWVIDRKLVSAIFAPTKGRLQSHRGSPNFEPHILFQLAWATGVIDHARAVAIQQPLFEAMAQQNQWAALAFLASDRAQTDVLWGPRNVDYRTLFGDPVLVALRAQVAEIAPWLPDLHASLTEHIGEAEVLAERLLVADPTGALPFLLGGTGRAELELAAFRLSMVSRAGRDTVHWQATYGAGAAAAAEQFLRNYVEVEAPTPFEQRRAWMAMACLRSAADESMVELLVKVEKKFAAEDGHAGQHYVGQWLQQNTTVSLRVAEMLAEPGSEQALEARARLGDLEARRHLADRWLAVLRGFRNARPYEWWYVHQVMQLRLWEVEPELTSLLAAALSPLHETGGYHHAVQLARAGLPEGVTLLVDTLGAPADVADGPTSLLVARVLREITGQNFGADAAAWRAWLLSRK